MIIFDYIREQSIANFVHDLNKKVEAGWTVVAIVYQTPNDVRVSTEWLGHFCAIICREKHP